METLASISIVCAAFYMFHFSGWAFAKWRTGRNGGSIGHAWEEPAGLLVMGLSAFGTVFVLGAVQGLLMYPDFRHALIGY